MSLTQHSKSREHFQNVYNLSSSYFRVILTSSVSNIITVLVLVVVANIETVASACACACKHFHNAIYCITQQLKIEKFDPAAESRCSGWWLDHVPNLYYTFQFVYNAPSHQLCFEYYAPNPHFL